MSLRAKRRMAMLAAHALILGVLLAGGKTLLPAAVLYLLSLRRLPFARWAAQLLVREAPCPACGWRLELVDRWRCPCGYTDPGERHLFTPCRNCGERSAFLECPACGAGIFL